MATSNLPNASEYMDSKKQTFWVGVGDRGGLLYMEDLGGEYNQDV